MSNEEQLVAHKRGKWSAHGVPHKGWGGSALTLKISVNRRLSAKCASRRRFASFTTWNTPTIRAA